MENDSQVLERRENTHLDLSRLQSPRRPSQVHSPADSRTCYHCLHISHIGNRHAKDSRNVKVGKRQIAHYRYVPGSRFSSDTGDHGKSRRLTGYSQRSISFRCRHAPVLAETQQRRSILVAILGVFLLFISFIISLLALYHIIDKSRPYRLGDHVSISSVHLNDVVALLGGRVRGSFWNIHRSRSRNLTVDTWSISRRWVYVEEGFVMADLLRRLRRTYCSS